MKVKKILKKLRAEWREVEVCEHGHATKLMIFVRKPEAEESKRRKEQGGEE